MGPISRLGQAFGSTADSGVRTPLVTLLPVGGIGLSELLLSTGAVGGALWTYTAALLACTLLSLRLPDRAPVLTGFALLATFRLVNLSMPVFLSLTLFWILLVYLPFVVVGCWLLWRSEVIETKLDRRGTLVGVPAAIAAGVALATVESSLTSVASLLPTITTGGLRLLAIVVVVATVAEELLFRGILQSALRRPLGPWLAVVVTSGTFAAMQAAFGWPAVAVAAGTGLVYGLGYELSESLLVPVACHVTVNTVLFVVHPALSVGVLALPMG